MSAVVVQIDCRDREHCSDLVIGIGTGGSRCVGSAIVVGRRVQVVAGQVVFDGEKERVSIG